jgi:hypothetical protein
VDGQSGILLGFFSKKTSSKVKLNTYCFSWLLLHHLQWIIGFRISSLLILASCMLFSWKYNRLSPSRRVHASICILITFCKVSQTFFQFLLIADFFLSLLLPGFFNIDFDFGLSYSFSYSHSDSNPYLVCSSIGKFLLEHIIF